MNVPDLLKATEQRSVLERCLEGILVQQLCNSLQNMALYIAYELMDKREGDWCRLTSRWSASSCRLQSIENNAGTPPSS